MRYKQFTQHINHEDGWQLSINVAVNENGKVISSNSFILHSNEYCLKANEKYRQVNKKKISDYHHQYYIKNKERVKSNSKIYYKSHKKESQAYYRLNRKKLIAYTIKYWKTPKGKTIRAKMMAKRKNLGFIPLNDYFEGSHAHHIDKEFVLFIPKFLHQSVPHNVWNGKNMEKINDIAIEWVYGI